MEAHRYGNWIFAVRSSGKKKGKWHLIATTAPRLRISLQEFSFKKLEICPLVSCQHPDMGVLYSVLPEDMYKKLPSLDEIHCNSHKTIDLGELKNAEAVIKAAKEGFNAALKTGGTDHWFVRQLIMACQPCNAKLTFCNAWMIENVKSRFILDDILEGKAMATLEKAGMDMVALAQQLESYAELKLKPHDGKYDVNNKKIPRYPPEVYVKGKRVYYLKDGSGGFWQQDTRGYWQAMHNPEVTEVRGARRKKITKSNTSAPAPAPKKKQKKKKESAPAPAPAPAPKKKKRRAASDSDDAAPRKKKKEHPLRKKVKAKKVKAKKRGK